MIARQTRALFFPQKYYLLLPAVLFWAITALAEYKVILKDGQTILAKTKPVSMEGAYHFRGIDNQMQVIQVPLVDVAATETANRDAASTAATRRVITNEDLRRAIGRAGGSCLNNGDNKGPTLFMRRIGIRGESQSPQEGATPEELRMPARLAQQEDENG